MGHTRVDPLSGLVRPVWPACCRLTDVQDTECACSADRGPGPGVFGRWAMQSAFEGQGSFSSAAGLARRHSRPGISDRSKVAALLSEHLKGKFSTCSSIMSSHMPPLQGHSPSTAVDILLLLRLLAGEGFT